MRDVANPLNLSRGVSLLGALLILLPQYDTSRKELVAVTAHSIQYGIYLGECQEFQMPEYKYPPSVNQGAKEKGGPANEQKFGAGRASGGLG